MKFNYPTVKELCKKIIDTREEIWRIRFMDRVLIKYKWHINKTHMSLLNYQFQYNKFNILLKIKMLDEVIEDLDKLISLKYKLADFDELESDIEWLKEYYQEKSWGNVIRWLSNINSTVRDTFSKYMEELKSNPNNNKWKNNTGNKQIDK